MVLENQHYFLLISIAEDSHDEFEDELDGQDEIVDSTAIGRTRNRWFYQLIVDDYPSLYDAHDPTQIDGVLIETTVTNEGGIERVLFSDYDEVREFQRRCHTAEIPFRLLNISSNSENLDNLPRFGLTDRQYEALTVALRQGYYDSPRRASTEEIAENWVSLPRQSRNCSDDNGMKS